MGIIIAPISQVCCKVKLTNANRVLRTVLIVIHNKCKINFSDYCYSTWPCVGPSILLSVEQF